MSMLSVIYAECRGYPHYAECHYVECRYVECRGTQYYTRGMHFITFMDTT
jgi:hypothetical protein